MLFFTATTSFFFCLSPFLFFRATFPNVVSLTLPSLHHVVFVFFLFLFKCLRPLRSFQQWHHVTHAAQMLRGWLLVRNSAARATKTRPLPRLPCEQIEADEMAVVHDVALGYSPAHRKQVSSRVHPGWNRLSNS
jgi:hypothetical protein